MGDAVPTGRTEWRARDARPGVRLVPLICLVVFGGRAAVDLGVTAANAWRSVDLVGLALVGLSVVVTGLETARMRVRVLDEGLEVRQLRTRRYPWSEVADVAVFRHAAGVRRVVVALRDGSSRTLPTPTTGRRSATDATLMDAVAAIERHLPPGRSRTLEAETSSLDDLLHD